MSICGVQGPSLATVLAFTIGEPAEDVARVERSAAHRMARERGWYGWRVTEITIAPEADDLARVTVEAKPVGPGWREGNLNLTFLTDQQERRRSDRLDGFLRACGVTERCDDTREILGRYFAIQNNGRSAIDFGPLTNALVQQ